MEELFVYESLTKLTTQIGELSRRTAGHLTTGSCHGVYMCKYYDLKPTEHTVVGVNACIHVRADELTLGYYVYQPTDSSWKGSCMLC